MARVQGLHNAARRVARGLALGLAAIGPVPALAADGPPGAQRLAWRDVADFLGLSPPQRQTLAASHAALERALADEASRAGNREHPAACRASREAVAAHHARLLASLSPTQSRRLADLDRALQLLPVVESAQAAGFLGASVAAAPPGLPAGAASAEFRWRREPAPALPGCPATSTTIHREVDRIDPSGGPPPQR
jgi:hypothetical protein